MDYAKEAEELFTKLSNVTTSLADYYLQLGMLQAQEREKKVLAYHNSGARTVTDKEKDAELSALHITLEIFKVRGEINALCEDKTYIQERLKWLNSLPKNVVLSHPVRSQAKEELSQ
jgi:hypothetical protein